MNTSAFYDSKARAQATRGYNTAQSEEIRTIFSYDELGQLLYSENALEQRTDYTYDNFGRMIREVHPDKGRTDFEYDLAGNLTARNMVNANIEYAYNYRRRVKKSYPQTANINTVRYTYGSFGDGKNGAGRVVQTVQGEDVKGDPTDVLVENFTYDAMGNVQKESRKIAIPFAGEYTFETQFNYDSWGRIHRMEYPDGEKVTYGYGIAGGLETVHSKQHLNEADPFSYIEMIGYDGYGNRSYMRYGNKVETNFTYDSRTRQLGNVSVYTPKAGGVDLLDKALAYYTNGNVQEVDNSATHFSGGGNTLGGSYHHYYSYDFDGRLKSSEGSWDGHSNDQSYTLAMGYNKAGGISTKNQTNTLAGSAFDYDFTYTYNNSKKHQIDQVADADRNTRMVFTYNSKGNVQQILHRDAGNNIIGSESFLWDEDDRLRAALNQDAAQHNVYDGNGIRLMKTVITESSAGVNGQNPDANHYIAPYTVYVNAYFVCQPYADHVLDMTKHYYTGMQRVASKLYDLRWLNVADPDPEPEDPEGGGSGGGGGSDPPPVLNNIVLEDLENILNNNPAAGIDFTELESQGLPALPAYFNYENHPCDDPENRYDPGTPEAYACLCRDNPTQAAAQGINCRVFREVYWYHPDYLGNTEFVTDLSGYPYQHFYYTPFGEALVDQHMNNGKYNNPYRFNAKELDPETGLYYYGARFYNPKLSIWLTVDPWADQYPFVTPYNFVENNPVMLLDPDGNGPIPPVNFKGIWSGLRNLWNSTRELFSGGDNTSDPPAQAPQQAESGSTAGCEDVCLPRTDVHLDPVDVSANDIEDNKGIFQSAPEGMYDSDPLRAFQLDLSSFVLNYLSPLGAIDNAVATAQDPNATATEQVNAVIDAVMAGAGGKGGRYVPRGANGKLLRTTKTKAGNTKIDAEARGSAHTQLRVNASGHYPQRTTFDAKGRKRADTHFTTHGEPRKSNPHKHTYYKNGRRAR